MILFYEVHVQGKTVDDKFTLSSKETVSDLKKRIHEKHHISFLAIELLAIDYQVSSLED